MKKRVFVDSSFLFALFVEGDEFHKDAVNIYAQLRKAQNELILTNFILDESFTLFRVKAGLEKALELRRSIGASESFLYIVRVSIEDESAVWDWFEKDWSKLSYTDCVSFAVMKRLDITHVASFDDHFARAGFTIVKPTT